MLATCVTVICPIGSLMTPHFSWILSKIPPPPPFYLAHLKENLVGRKLGWKK